MNEIKFAVRAASWEKDAGDIMHIRHSVFVQEQQVPESIESDDFVGVAKSMLKLIIELAEEQNLKELYLHAQLGARGLYDDFGFTASGKPFMEANIEHIKMTRP